MTKFATPALLAALAMSVGCVHQTRGTKALDAYDPATAIVKGQTTKQQVVDQLGDPQSSTSESDGTEIDVWTMAKGSAVVAPFYHRNHVSVRHLRVTFKDGVAQSFTTSDNESM